MGMMREDEVVAWHLGHSGREFARAPGEGERQGSQGCCRPGVVKRVDTAEQLSKDNNLVSGTFLQ